MILHLKSADRFQPNPRQWRYVGFLFARFWCTKQPLQKKSRARYSDSDSDSESESESESDAELASQPPSSSHESDSVRFLLYTNARWLISHAQEQSDEDSNTDSPESLKRSRLKSKSHLSTSSNKEDSQKVKLTVPERSRLPELILSKQLSAKSLSKQSEQSEKSKEYHKKLQRLLHSVNVQV